MGFEIDEVGIHLRPKSHPKALRQQFGVADWTAVAITRRGFTLRPLEETLFAKDMATWEFDGRVGHDAFVVVGPADGAW